MSTGRRSFLIGAGALGAGAVVSGCTSNSSDSAGSTNVNVGQGDNDKAGRHVTIGFSAPEADHGWIGAIAANAKNQAGQYKDVTLQTVEGTNDVNQQISQVETLISKRVDVIVMLPYDGKSLTATGLKAMQAGIPVINLDRAFSDPRASRTWIGGDNYGMGAAAGRYIAQQMKAKGIAKPVIAEIQGIANLPLTQDRTRGFADALKSYGLSVTNRVSASFTAETGQQATANLLEAANKIDAIFNQDDDQGVGVLAAIQEAKRDEFILVSGAGSKNMLDQIKAGNSVVKADVTYPPSMAASAIKLARLVAQGKHMSDLVEPEIPVSITLNSALVTSQNVDRYLPFAFKS